MEYILVIIAAWFAYMSFHFAEEQRKGKHIPLPLEKD